MHPDLKAYLEQELTPLQKTALERIGEIKKALAEKGLYVRSAMELEFMVKDEQGNIYTEVIPLQSANIDLEDGEHVRLGPKKSTIIKGLLNRQGLDKVEIIKKDDTSEYEIVVADITDLQNRPSPKIFSPENIAVQTSFLKAHGLEEILRNTTCLSSAAQGLSKHFSPLFDAHPYAHIAGADSLQNKKTSALHVNASLYDEKGNNILHAHPVLREACANSLVEIQANAALSMLPTAASLERIGLNDSAPGWIKIIDGPGAYGFQTQKPSSVSIRITQDPDHTRIENRLPGADADPIVAMAVSMAALLDATNRHVEYDGNAVTVNGEMPSRAEPQEITKHFTDLVDKMRKSKHMRAIIGEKLYDAILEEYGAPQSQEAIAR